MIQDGIHGMLPREQMAPEARKQRDFYDMKPGAPFVQTEFGFYSLDVWYEQGLDPKTNRGELFGFDASGQFNLRALGWCEAELIPQFDEVMLEDRGEHEVVQDRWGRAVLYFKGRRSGFMPEYLDHPVKDRKTWEEKIKWRMNPASPERQTAMDGYLPNAVQAAQKGYVLTQCVAGGYMYLRSLIGPAELLYTFYDQPELIHDCMQTWLTLADDVIARHQQHVTLDELYIAEDICYNHGPLISPDMMRAFLFPYYQQLITNIKRRQLDRARHLFFQVDTDGFCDPTIPVYGELGLDIMSPFEVASGCDVVRTGWEYPNLRMRGGVDKRILASTKDEIDRMVDRIFPAMRARGGYTPTCDHGVPEEVSLENYLHFRKRCLEFAK